MRIKKGDTVKVIAGKDKGATGKVLKTIPKEDKVVVEKVNVVTKHLKPRGPQQPGGIEKQEAPIHVSNVQYFVDGKVSKIGYRIEDGKKVRFAKSNGKTIK